VLDIEDAPALVKYLRRTGRIGRDETPTIRVLAGGVSNRTVRVERPGGEAWVLKQALAKLRVEADWFGDPARVQREAQGMRALRQLAPPGTITPLVFEDPAHHLLAMGAVPEPHENFKTMLLAGRIDVGLVESFGRLLGRIHRGARERRAELADAFADRSHFESLRLEPYYGFAAKNAPAAAPFLRALIDETRAQDDTLVHGDYSPKNVLVRDGRLTLLDHEVIHWGDGMFDIGFSLTHLLSKAHHRPDRRADFARAAHAYLAAYLSEAGPLSASAEARAVRHTLGCLLARVAGRSPLEYLDAAERARQRATVESLLSDPPRRLDALIDEFVGRLGT
jgi:tRNA A-37 threonylcarbamoyl transferase component Bud32